MFKEQKSFPEKTVKLIMGMFLTFCVSLGFEHSVSSFENLDELETRVSRKEINTFYSGESSDNNYLWQPQTVCYTDIITGHEVWVMTSTDDKNSLSGHEYGHQPWSADGKYFSIALDRNTAAFTRGSYSNNEVWFTVKSDGTGFRPRINAPARTCVHARYTHWSPTIPDVYYEFGRGYAGESGGDQNMLYKVNVNDHGLSMEPWLDFIAGNTSTQRDLCKDVLTSDGKYILATAWSEVDVVSIGTIEPTPNLPASLIDYDMNRNLDTYWLNTPEGTDHWHDEMFVGANGNYWIYFLFTTGSWWRMRPWGTDNNPPDHTVDHTAPYAWWEGTDEQREIQPVNGLSGVLPFTNHYWSHAVPDRWGTHIAYSDAAGSYVAPGVCDVETDTRTAFPNEAKGAQYHAWTGWTDYTTGTNGATNIYSMKYNDGTTHKNIASIHATTGGMFTKPGQSPDGTKTTYRSDFLQPTSVNGDVFFVAAYYPYPPEIIQGNASNGLVNIRFDWRLGQLNPRGYTTRGWPDEHTDTPPPPREIEEFRLWRSPDSYTWIPVGTVSYDIFSRYDFSDGIWLADDYWEIQDTPSNGTWFYALTAKEWSGLESRALSNVYRITLAGGSGTGIQSISYPSNPGGDSDFYTTLPNAPGNVVYTHRKTPADMSGQYTIEWSEPADNNLIRYYNIYAEDGSLPSVHQANRIASIPKNFCNEGDCSWVDWLGNLDGSTQYVVTSVDYQGNESSITTPLEDGNDTQLQVKEYKLSQNYPNPFNPTTTIEYSITNVGTGHAPSVQHVCIVVYDMLGSEVATLVDEQQRPGIYKVRWDASHLSSGVYFYQLKTGDFIQVKKLILMK